MCPSQPSVNTSYSIAPKCETEKSERLSLSGDLPVEPTIQSTDSGSGYLINHALQCFCHHLLSNSLSVLWGSLRSSELIHKVSTMTQETLTGKLAKLPDQPIINLQMLPLYHYVLKSRFWSYFP